MGYDVGAMSLWQLLVSACLWWLIFGWPITRILKKMGYSPWWVLLVFVPVANIVGLWLLATKRWPREGA